MTSQLPGSAEEVIRAGATLARRIAPEMCYRDAASGKTCATWHGFWEDMRLLGVGAEPRNHAAFYRHALLELVRLGGHRRVLVSGAIDWAMMEETLRIYREAGAEAAFSLVDLCGTSVELNRWYANREGIALEATQSDILDYRAATPFDVIVTHSLIVMFDPERRRRLARRWFELLRPGGIAVTVTRLWRGHKEEIVRFTPEQKRDFVAAMRQKAADYPGKLDLTPDQFAAIAESYCDDLPLGWPVRSAAEVVELFESAGFEIADFQVTTMAGTKPYQSSAPTFVGGSPYAMIAAIRR